MQMYFKLPFQPSLIMTLDAFYSSFDPGIASEDGPSAAVLFGGGIGIAVAAVLILVLLCFVYK